jgi:hypothetical protein
VRYLDRRGGVLVGVIDGAARVLHDDELTIKPATVRALVDRTLPDCRALPLRRLTASGSTNALFRLGEDLLLRLPAAPAARRPSSRRPLVGASLPVRVPTVIAVRTPVGAGRAGRPKPAPWPEQARQPQPGLVQHLGHVG